MVASGLSQRRCRLKWEEGRAGIAPELWGNNPGQPMLARHHPGKNWCGLYISRFAVAADASFTQEDDDVCP